MASHAAEQIAAAIEIFRESLAAARQKISAQGEASTGLCQVAPSEMVYRHTDATAVLNDCPLTRIV
jgi:hypothetical protein